ncbi:MAG: hypothetical protein ACRC8S_01430 [Fimbriiglobus sp.]
MWTPRRILLLIVGMLVMLGVYLGYSQVLGGVDGLPELPSEYRISTAESGEEQTLPPPPQYPTRDKLKMAFGPGSPEATDNGLAYKLKTELRDKGMVLACGQPVFTSTKAEPSRKVIVSPFSIAFFGKAKAPNELITPGEMPEISTFHADKAELEFDKPVATPQDIRDAKLIGFVLTSTPDQPSTDLRSGKIWVTNNQKSRDPAQFLVFSTPGPIYYLAPKENEPPRPDVAQVWTNASVEVVDRRNLVRPIRSLNTNTLNATGDQLRARGTVAAMLLGEMLPPPTIVAEGMKIYLNADQPDPKSKGEKKNTTGYSGVRVIELARKVQFHLWSDGGTGFPGTNPGAAPTATNSDVLQNPPLALGGLGGAVIDGVGIGQKFANRTLLIIETPGSFRFDYTTYTAKFESESQIATDGPNLVEVTRLAAGDKQDNLFCTNLLVEFENPNSAPQPKTAKPGVTPATGGMKIRSLLATGKQVSVSVEGEELLAVGNELRYIVDAKKRMTTTILKGSPVEANRDKNKLKGGSERTPGEIIITSIEPAPNTKDVKKTTLMVNGAGVAELYDAATGNKTVKATWGKSLTQEKVRINDQDQDFLKFEGGAAFIDEKANMDLVANQIWLWLGRRDAAATVGQRPLFGTGQVVPLRLDAAGDVRSKSPELVIKDNDQLRIWFRDVPPPVLPTPVATAPAPMPVVPAPKTEVAVAPPAKVEPVKPKPPIILAARLVESWVTRYPQAVAATTPPKPNSSAPLKYEMERAVCEDRVIIHQDPTDPAKNPRGLDIMGSKVTLKATRIGAEVAQEMVVTGTMTEIAQVHFETLSIFGPSVKIDQASNTVAVDGLGSLLMPSSSDMSGNPSDKPNELEIRWVKSMFFNGAKGTAEFLGQVNATQRPAREGLIPPAPVAKDKPKKLVPALETWAQSRVLCHRLDATFDKPVYFNQLRKDDKKKEGEEGPKLKTALCIPIPDDEVDANTPALVRKVTFTDETYSKADKLLKAQKIESKQLDIRIRDKMQEIFASGPGEVRILQPDGGGEFGKPTVPKPARPAGEQAPFKLTLVKFTTRMEAVDKNKLFQKATFNQGASCWQIPTNNINLSFAPHEVPDGTTSLSCTESLEVSTAKARPDADPEQELVAIGNADFTNDDYDGLGTKITYNSRAVTLFGSKNRDASIYRRKRSVAVNPGGTGKKLSYLKDGNITVDESGGGAFNP